MALPEIRLLEASIAVAEDLNFSRAAERLHIDQSTLSRRIFDLETQLGFRLFERNKQGVEITDAGRKFVEEARQAVLHVERAVLTATAAIRGMDEVLNIGRSSHTDPYLVSMLTAIRLALFPRLKMKVWSNHPTDLVHDLITGGLDLALIPGNSATPKLSCLMLAEEPLYIAMSTHDPLADRQDLRLRDLNERNWVLFSRQANPEVYAALQVQISNGHVAPADQHEVTTPEEAIPLILSQEGVALLNRAGAWRIAQDGITMRPLAEDNLKFRTSLAVLADNKARLVAEFVRATGRKLDAVRQPVQQRLHLSA
ncbi:MAG: LysR family transcriptional regulator [Acidobacteriaceae bacterium]